MPGPRLQRERIHEAEHGGIHADPKREQNDRDDGEAGLTRKQAESESHVLYEMIPERQPADISNILTSARERAEIRARQPLRLRRAGPTPLPLGRLHRDMKGHLTPDLVVDL